MEIIARIHTDFAEKFGIPRQSGLVRSLTGEIRFEPKYRSPDYIRGIEGFSHLWLIWQFDEPGKTALVRPPRLGGNTKMGVFATRSPFRPNPLGLSCVKLERVEKTEKDGCVLHVSGCDMVSGTAILDIKPYLPFADCVPGASGGFADEVKGKSLDVVFPEALLEEIPPEKRETLIGLLAQDIRPGYQDDPGRHYGMGFAGWDIRFTVADGVLTVEEVVPADRRKNEQSP